MLRVGIDVGGTFTDVAAFDDARGELVTLKVPTTPREPERGVADSLKALLASRRDGAASIEFLGHSTTIATNALLGQLGLDLPRVALVTTEGFRDVIEIGRQNRSDVYDLFVTRPRPLAARADRFTVKERIDRRGDIVEPLDDASLERVCRRLQACDGLAAVAICLLNSYANDAHERRVAAAVGAALPGVTIVRSAEVDPQYREYERFSTAVVNAALGPIVARYLERLKHDVRALGATAPLYVMRSDGGLATADYAIGKPAALIESGPAGGVVAAAALGARAGTQRLIALDMGGTTAKAGTILDGRVQVAGEFEAAGRTHSGRAVRGSGYPVRFPFVDLAEISAGGGTIASIDGGGCLRVGPLSAGADPGPACYGRSGPATVTDANVVLGRLNPSHLLGGDFPIDAGRAHAAVAALAGRLKLAPEAAAAGIVTLINAQMSKVLRIVTLERGLDPRDFTLAAFGGGGPLHACALADELGIARILVPERPGIFSARGLLDAELRETYVHAVLCEAGDGAIADLDRLFAAAERRGRDAVLAQGADPSSLAVRHEFDARYAGQSFELTVAYARAARAVRDRFHRAHRTRYGYDAVEEPVELVNARTIVSGTLAARPTITRRHRPSGRAIPARRSVWQGDDYVSLPVFARDTLPEGATIEGPAIVEQYDATTFVERGWHLSVNGDVLCLERRAAA